MCPVRVIETDYLVLGAGASGMAFTDTLVSRTSADVVMLDRNPAPGGHWLDAYPFVRLHQPSACYGVPSTQLGSDRIDDAGPNAGFYERARGDEIRDYFANVMEQRLLPAGRVTFLPLTDYRGEDVDGHHLVSRLTGQDTVVKVRSRFVDATPLQAEIPARHALPFAIHDGIRVLPPNDLGDLDDVAGSFTVIGAGKTSMDTCGWLLEMGVEPDRIRWIRSRESWLFDRAVFQPLDLVSAYVRLQADWVEAAAAAADASAFAHDLEERRAFVRIDPNLEPGIWRGATISRVEVDALRTIERVIRKRHVKAISAAGVTLDDGELLTAAPGEIYVDCTAAGTPAAATTPAFEPGRIALRYVTVGLTTWSAAIFGAVEALPEDDATKNQLCVPVPFTGEAAGLLDVVQAGLRGEVARTKNTELLTWNQACRLNPARGAAERMADDPALVAAFSAVLAGVGPALRHLAGRPAVAASTT